LYGRGIITFYPSSLRFLQLPPPDVPEQPIRLPSPGPARLPFERVRPGRPLVYVTLGTVFNTAVDLLRTIVAGVAALDVEVLVCAMGCVLAGAAESLAPVPPPREFLAYVTDPTAVTATQVSEATTGVLETPTYRQAAQRIAAEIAAAPAPSSIRPWLTSRTGNG
jgi:UDP:flavonoid glycosyltransferase YjiC (YdhE family)